MSRPPLPGGGGGAAPPGGVPPLPPPPAGVPLALPVTEHRRLSEGLLPPPLSPRGFDECDSAPDLSATAALDALPPAHRDEARAPAGGVEAVGFGARRHRLECVEVDCEGRARERSMTRAEIIQAARETLPKNAPSPKAVARWLERPEVDSAELRAFGERLAPGRDGSRKAVQKALRHYLRNSLQPRDIRQVDAAFSGKPALWVRHSALVVSLEGVRAIVLHDKVFVFDLRHPVARTAVKYVQQSVTAGQELLDDPDLPFELRALEGILIVGVLGLEREFNALAPEIERLLHALPARLTSKMLEQLRARKQALAQLLSRAHGVRDILEKLLDEDDDMANMYLSEKHAAPDALRDATEHDQVEMLLEAYMQVLDELVSRADLLSDAVDDTEDLVMIHLDTLRNKLLSVELGLSVVSMTCGLGGVVTGVFGMNLPIPLFDASASPYWFLGVVAALLVAIVALSWALLATLRRRGLYSS